MPSLEHREHDEMPRNKYGYAETNVATHRRKSMAGVRRNSSKELDGDDSDLMQVKKNFKFLTLKTSLFFVLVYYLIIFSLYGTRGR